METDENKPFNVSKKRNISAVSKQEDEFETEHTEEQIQKLPKRQESNSIKNSLHLQIVLFDSMLL